MTLSNFEHTIDPLIVERGYDYYRAKRVEYEDADGSTYSFFVRGTEEYRVLIECAENNIQHCECDCPYDMGPTCKHIVAALYAVRDVRSGAQSGAKRLSVRTQMSTLLAGLSVEQLRTFVAETARGDRGFRSLFLSYFAVVAEGVVDYFALVRDILAKYTESDYGVDIIDTSKAVDALSKLLEHSGELLAKKRFEEVFQLNRAVLENVVNATEDMDDSSEDVFTVIEEVFINFEHLAEQSQYGARLLEYAMEQLSKAHHEYFGRDALYDLMVCVTDKANYRKVLEFLRARLGARSGSGADTEYDHTQILLCMYRVIERCGDEKEAYRFVSDNIHVPKFGAIRFDYYRANKRYQEALQLCDDGVRVAQERGHPGTAKDWLLRKLEIAKLCRDRAMMRELLGVLLVDSSEPDSSMDYYRHLKALYSAQAWKEVREEIVGQLKDRVIAMDIYSKEGEVARLYELVQEEVLEHEPFWLLKRYAVHLEPRYSQEMVAMCARIIEQESNVVGEKHYFSGRKQYQKIVKRLQFMRALKGGAAPAQRLAHRIVNRYPNRPAVLDEVRRGGFAVAFADE